MANTSFSQKLIDLFRGSGIMSCSLRDVEKNRDEYTEKNISLMRMFSEKISSYPENEVYA
ncbi:hypothetical protein IJS77_02300 [bacterium]|nr:hypothetical protein [bacterium]